MSRESILERNRKRAQENDQKMGATALGTSALNYSTQQSLERAAAEKVARESAGGLVDVPQPWLDTITPVTPSSRSARRWSGTTPSSRGGGFGETESQGRGYFSQADYSFLDRANDVIQGGLRQWAGGVGSAAGNVLDRTTSRYNSDAAGQWLDLVQDSMENRDDESYFERPEVQDRLENIRETREQTAPFIQEIYDIAEETGRQGTEQIERAKADLGPVGSFAVDVGTQVPQMLADAAFGAVTGGSALLPLGVRSYGYGVQEAMENGADRDQAAMYGVASGAKEALTEKLFSVALPFSRIYGGGSFDDAIQRGIQTAVERFASTPTGQRIVGGGLSLGASALTEGAEEFISDWLGWQMPRIYGGDVATAEETLSDSLYDFLVGAAVGGLGGVVSPSTYNYRLPTGQESAGGVVNSDTTTGMEAPESPGSVQNTAQNDSIPEATRRAVDLLVSGQEITGGQAERIARRPEAVALLGQLTGTEINTDAPLSRVKADIRAVAGTRAASGSVSGQGQVNTQAGQRTTDTSHQAERTAAQRVHDANRVRGAAASTGMGESGQRAISAAYDGSVDADRYYAGFTAYYEAGLSGRAQEQVRSDYAADLTEAQKFAAYTAGQNDAAASLQREQAGVNYATVYGDEAGFVPSEHSASLSQETTRFYNVLAKATGTKITVTAATGEGGANGWYRDGTIYISSDAQNAGEVVAMHEITHRLQEIAPEAYRKYRDYAVNALSELEGNSSALVERYKTLYSNSGINLTTEEAMDEAAANFAGELIRDPERFERLAREDRGVARRLLDAVKDLIRKIRRAIHGPSAEDVAVMNELGLDLDTLEQAARLWEDALRAGRETTLQAGARDGRMGTTRNSLKEDRDHGRTREETRGAFLRRAAGAGYAVYEGETAGAYGYRRVDRESARENAGQIQAEISNLGIEADIISGPILINRNGKTIERPVSHAVTIDRARILVNENSTLPPRNVAGHEAFHLWKSGVGRDAYIETVEDNLDFTREGFRNYQSAVSYALFGEEADLSDDGQMARLREELLAYISGDIHEGTNEDALRPMFRDFDAVRAAWEQLVEENRGGTRYSLKSDSEALEELQSENGRLNRRIQELSRQVAELKRSPEFSNFENEVRNAQDGELDRIVARYTEWEEASGLTAASRELEDLNRQARDVRRNLERARTEAARRAREEYRALYNEEFAKRYASKAARRFGTTSRFDLSGYLTVNGSLLDFSDRQGYRVRDHREIAGVLDFLPEYAEYSDGMIEFMNLGNIRMQSYGIDISRAPNSKQRSVLRRFFNSLDGEVTVDFSRQDGGTDGSIDYPEGTRADRILNDIDHYFSTGVVPEQSMVSQFHTRYSLKVDSDGRALSQEQQDYFRDSVIRDDQGRLMVMYHGTRNGGFTIFDGGKDYFCFTNNRRYAYAFEGRKGNGQLYPATRADIEAGLISPQMYEVYLNVTNPFIAEQDVVEDALYWDRSLAQQLRDRGYDALMMEDMSQVIVLSPEQIKNVTNKTPTDDPDIRRSIRGGSDILRENAALQEENALLRERVEYWRGQTRRTTPGQVDKKAVDRAALELIRDFDSTISAADISGDLLSLYNYMGTGRDGNDELTYTEARRRADEIARRVVESAQITEDGVYQEYRELRDYLRSTPLSISQEDASDIADYNDFRRRNFGRLNLRSGDTNIDQVYQELSEMWPEFFDEVRENNPVDQLLHISEVAEQLYRISAGNPFAGNLREAQAGVSNEILERFFDIPQVRATFADRAAQAVENERQRGRERVNRVREQRDARITQLRQQNRERVQRAIQRERDTRERQLERMKNRYQARDAAGRERRTARELRARISRHVKDLSRKLLRPSDKQHIPEQLRTAVAAMLDAINLESVYTVDPETGKRRKGGEGDPTKRTEAFRALREQYEAILNRPDDYSYTGVLDPNLMDNLAEVIRMRDTPLFEMSLDQLTTVWQTVKGVEASITSANKLLGESRYAGVAELAYGIRESSRGKRQKNNYGGSGLGRITGFGDQLLNTDMMNSLTFLHLFGDGGDALYHELQAARDQKTRIMQETVRLAKQVVGKTNVDKLQKKIHTFQVEGGELKLSTAQLMSLYELNQRQQAQAHIYKGGIRPGPRSSFVSRDKSPGENVAAVLGRMDAPSSVVRVTQADVVNMLSELSEEEIRIADGLQSIMQGYLADEGNRESMKVYGYEKFTEDHYFPISSDPNQVQSKIGDILEGGERRPVSVSEWGSAKSTVTGANNGLLLGDIFDVFAQHAVDMSTYASHLGALEDVNRVRNFAFRNAEGHRSGTIKEIIQRVAGKGGNAYLDKLLQDISRGTARGGVAGLSRLTANYKAASVGLNLRVALQQPTSYARALAVMSPKYLADPRVLKSGGWKKALKYAPIAQWKDWGNFEINQGRQFQNILFDTDGTMDRLRNRAMTLASVMDSATWGRLWNACELEILDTRPSLQEGSEEFYSAVAQRFTDVVDQTQVVDNVLGRSQFMRSGDNLAKMAASYMGEPTQTYNMLYRAYRDTVQEQDPKKRSQAIKRLGRTAAAVTFSAFMTAVAAALWDGVRDDEDRDEKYWERVLKHIGPNFAQNVNPVGMLPYARDILSIVQGYDVSRMDLEAVTSLFSALQNMQKAVNGEGRYTIRGAALNLAAELSRITGLPMATVKRDAEAIARAVGVETEDWYFQYQVERALNSVFYSGNRGEFYDIAFGALADGDLDVYEQITQDLMSQGVKGSTIESAMRSRLKAAQESDPNFSMSQAGQDLIGGRPQYHVEAEEKGSFSADDLSPEARTSYNEQRAGDYREWVDALEENGGFGKLDDEGKDKLLSAADQLASDIALRDHSQGAFTETDMDQWERWASKGAEYGVDPSEALLFKTAYDMAESEKDEDGDPISGSKKENALELAADLMPWLTDRELEYLMSNYWAPEDRVLKEMKEGKFLG